MNVTYSPLKHRGGLIIFPEAVHHCCVRLFVVVYTLVIMPEHRYSRKRFVQEWNVKPRRGRQSVRLSTI